MVNLRPDNAKLMARARGIVAHVAADDASARRAPRSAERRTT